MKLTTYLLTEARGDFDGTAEEIIKRIVGKSKNPINTVNVQIYHAKKQGKTEKVLILKKALELLKKGVKPQEHPHKESPQVAKPKAPETKAPVEKKPESGAERILTKLSAAYTPKESLKQIEKFLAANHSLTDIEKRDLTIARDTLKSRLSAGNDTEKTEVKTDTVAPIKQKKKATFQEIGDEIGVTKMGAQKITQNGLVKVFKGLKKMNPDMPAEDIIHGMIRHLDPDKSDMKKLISILPDSVKKRIGTRNISEAVDLSEQIEELFDNNFIVYEASSSEERKKQLRNTINKIRDQIEDAHRRHNAGVSSRQEFDRIRLQGNKEIENIRRELISLNK